MNPGAFDTYVTIQRNNATTLDDFNEDVAAWETFCTAWAKVDFASVKESKTAEQIIAAANNVFTIHYQAGITADMRIIDADNNIYNITGQPKQIGRKQYLLIETKLFDNE